MKTTNQAERIVALDPKTGCQLRQATKDEAAAFMAQPVAYRNALRVGAVLVDDTSDPSLPDHSHLPIMWV